jgi:succinate dehydrogenase/fumarate reductase-like Fe-S protein
MSTLKTHTRRKVRRIRDTVVDMNYAQRRLVEVKLGIPPEESRYRSAKRQEIEELEALFELEPVTAETDNLV